MGTLDIFSAWFCCKVLIKPIVALVQRVVSRFFDGNGAIVKKYQFNISTILLFILNNDLHGVPDLLHYDLNCTYFVFNYIKNYLLSLFSRRENKVKTCT